MSENILVVSLPHDLARRERLRNNFPLSFTNFKFINAVDGRTLTASKYFQCVKGYLHKHSSVLTPTEVGCALSHMMCLEFVRRSNRPLLILEDDVMGSDSAISSAIEAMSHMSEAEVMFMGGMQDLPSWERLYGVRRKGSSLVHRTYDIDPLSYKYLWRSCCYAITPNAAELILRQQKTVLHRADDWGFFFSALPIRAALTNLLAHPSAGIDSNIADERANMNYCKKLSQIAAERFKFNLSHRLFPWPVALKRLQKIN